MGSDQSEADMIVGTSGSASGSDGGHVADDVGEANADEEGGEWSELEEGDGTKRGGIRTGNGEGNRKDEAERRERMRGVFGGLIAQLRTRFEGGPPVVLGQEDEPASKKARLDARLLNKAACFQATYGPEVKGGTAGDSGTSEPILESFWLVVGSGECSIERGQREQELKLVPKEREALKKRRTRKLRKAFEGGQSKSLPQTVAIS